MHRTLLTLFCLLLVFLQGNPFLLPFPPKEILTEEDYEEVQRQLQAIDIAPFLDDFYPANPPKKRFLPWISALATKEDFYSRISKATKQILIDRINHKIPIKKLIQIGNGGNNCLVSYASFNGKYTHFLETLPKQLEEVGFNGHLLYMIGGFPNPTGREIRYAAVPYCFKVFALLEASKLGFSKVLWIDSAFLPLKDPTPLFDWLEKEGSFLKQHESFVKFILPKTRDYLKTVTGVDVLSTKYVSTQVFGLDLSLPASQNFIRDYYKLVDLGFPFFSCFPEEYVFSSIMGQEPSLWKEQPFRTLVFPETKLRGKPISDIKKAGYFFLQKEH